MMTDEATPHESPESSVLQETAPRSAEDKPWEHPADAGAPLGGGDFWNRTEAFGFFQGSGEFPDDLAQAIRNVYEKMNRAGFRDWEAEWDYVECSYWFLRRHLEVNAREVFRVWYGEDWNGPFRVACHRQEIGEVEYRIDHLLTTEFEVLIRKQPQMEGLQEAKEDLKSKPLRSPFYGELTRTVREKVPAFMKPGEVWNSNDIATQLQKLVEFHVEPYSVYITLQNNPDLFDKRILPGQWGRNKAHFLLKDHPPSSSHPPEPQTLDEESVQQSEFAES